MCTVNSISDITFRIRNNIDDCYNSLLKEGYEYIEGDIRLTCDGKCCALGYKLNGKEEPVTNIIGTISDGREPQQIIQNGCTYKMIVDENFNGDIHKGSGGNYLYLYSTKDECHMRPIKDLIYGNYKYKKSSKQEVVQNSERSKRKFDLDLCAGRSAYYGYIYIIRV